MLRVRRPLVGLDCAAKQHFCLGKAILLQPKDPQTIDGIEVTIVASENLGIKRLGLAQPALPMEGDRLLKYLQQIRPRILHGLFGGPHACWGACGS